MLMMSEVLSFLNKVFCADVLDILTKIPDDSVDVTVTSPPYNKGEDKKGWLVTNVKYPNHSDRMPESEYQEWQVRVLNEILRVTKPGGSLFYNHKIRWEKGILIHPFQWVSRSKWIVRQEIIWDRMIAGNIRGWRFWQVDERIYWLIKSERGHLIGKELAAKHARLTSIWRITPEQKITHPSPFPVEIPTRAIYSVMENVKGGVVLDPFCGSGTTLVVAKILGHNYIGIDISPQYVEMSVKRLNEWELEKSSVFKEIERHFVEKTFKERKARGEFTGKYAPVRNREDSLFPEK